LSCSRQRIEKVLYSFACGDIVCIVDKSLVDK